MPRRKPSGATGEKRRIASGIRRFLDRLRAGDSVTAAARTAGISRDFCYDHRTRDPDFAAAWDRAIDEGLDELEDVARRRAVAGSDTLVMFLLNGGRPHKYRRHLTVDAKAVVTVDEAQTREALQRRLAGLAVASGADSVPGEPQSG